MNKKTFKKKFISIALSTLTAFSSGTVAMTTALCTATPVVYAADELTGQDKKMLKAEEKMIFTVTKDALKPFCPWIGYVTESLDIFLGLTGVLDDGGNAGNSISKKDLSELRKEINSQLNDIKKQIAATGEYVTEEFNNTLISNSFGKGLDTLHASVDIIARQIESTNRNKNLTENEKLVEIASKIGGSSEWAKDTSNFVNQISVIRAMLQGKTFSDLKERDIYQVLYDHYKTKCLFSSEIYDKETPYIKRALCEYFYDYSVMLECMEAALKVSKFTDEEVNALSANQKNIYYSIASLDTVIEDEMVAQTLEMFDIYSEDSVISRYLTYLYNSENSRYTYVDKGRELKSVFHKLKSGRPYLKADVGEIKVINHNGSDNTNAHTAYSQTKESLESTVGYLYIMPEKIKEMAEYVNSAYPGKFNSVWDYLKDRGYSFNISEDCINMLVSDKKVTEWSGYYSKNGSGEFDFWQTEGYTGFIYGKKSFTPEKYGIYTLRHRRVHADWAYQSISYQHYYSAYSTNEYKSKPIEIFNFIAAIFVNTSKFSEKKDAETGTQRLYVDCNSQGSAGQQKCVIQYRKNGQQEWNNIYVPSSSFDIGEYSNYQFRTVITDEAGQRTESKTYTTPVSYVDSDGSQKTVAAKLIDKYTSSLESGWYAVVSDTEIDSRIICRGDVHIILCNDSKLTAPSGITVNENEATLTIYSQKNGTGTLEAESYRADCAAIGGTAYNAGGKITINGGNISAKGNYAGAGIGGGQRHSGTSEIVINGGTINAQGSDFSAAIGSGARGNANITINGGTVNVQGTKDGSSIGGGVYGNANITINGGNITSSGKIGGGYKGTADITLNWKNDTDSIISDSYNGTVTLEKVFNDGKSNLGIGKIEDNSAINGKTLVPGLSDQHTCSEPEWV